MFFTLLSFTVGNSQLANYKNYQNLAKVQVNEISFDGEGLPLMRKS